MRVQASVKPRCSHCMLVRRMGVVRVICNVNPRHKQRQGKRSGVKKQKKTKKGKYTAAGRHFGLVATR